VSESPDEQSMDPEVPPLVNYDPAPLIAKVSAELKRTERTPKSGSHQS
jgi:hypothetical protein